MKNIGVRRIEAHMRWMDMIRASAMTLALGVGASGLMAQSKPAAGSDSAMKTSGAAGTKAIAESGGAKVAAINMRAAIANTAEGKQAAAQLETEFQSRRKELEDLNKKVSDLQQRLNAGASTLSDEEKQRLTAEGQKLSRQLERRQNEFQEDLSDAQNEVISRIGRKIVEVLGKYAPGNGFGAVLDDSSQTTPVMYAATDITEEVVKLYDQTYPVKSAAGGKASGK
jgi:outer membrane protein